MEPNSDVKPPQSCPGVANKYDEAARRPAYRKGRERGVWIYVPASELVRAGVDPYGATPFYRMWGTKRGGLMVRLYRER